MRRTSIFTILLLAVTAAFASVNSDSALEIEPQMEHRYASNIATRFLTNYHYKRTRLDDELSSDIFDHYLELLDPSKIYFLSGDIETFERYRAGLDDALRHSDLAPAYDIFNVYVTRVQQRVDFARDRVKKPFDFTVDEFYQYDREEEPWVSTSQELDELWRKRVKNDYLRLLLTDKEPEAIVETLTERYDNLERRINELNTEDVFQFFMNAFAQSIEPHTAYLSARTSENFEISMKLSLEGIGALLGRENEYTLISSVVPGGPADQDGRLKAGDRITAVGQGNDGKMVDVIGWRVDDVVDLIRGPKDTVVRLEVLPEDASVSGPTTVIDIVRNEVKLEEQAAQSEIIEVPVEGSEGETVKIGVIDLPVFYMDFAGRAQNKPDYRSSTRDVRRLIGELEEQGVAGIIVDLRNNGGGSLLEATTLTGLFIDTGPVVQVRNSSGRISLEEDVDPGMAWEGPLAVMVNRYSASASEIFAAAIQDYGRGVVIGEPTFGKGTVQSLLDLDDYAPSDKPGMGQLKITMAQFFRVNGGSTQNLGVEPDIRFPSFGDPQEYGERSMDNALPWTSIDPARYQSSGDLSQLVAVADDRYQDRILSDEEFGWLMSDIDSYNKRADEKSISLLESVGREKMKEQEEKKAARKAAEDARGPLLAEGGTLVEPDPELGDFEEEAASDEDEEEEDEGPDLLLREAARIVVDMVELESDLELLKRQYAQLDKDAKEVTAVD
ncbi:MAG: carboxy terminal-processing peptidase [Xanthomonadales bacterium]|nr:carboxy terminal-processing peptidase [Xanthomonadales bacterium]MDH3923375.1 carboxy terminal-processing peptidase [Xanthomonadales bacterium]MDH3939389.1 carboxy terminal-processing peptidase [Xanthomonadales bacterium]MDH4001233.1 carboxy terminal-processing peptidase [Xanthomonadales bacterium]